jgi:hypothetical protein
MPPRRGGSTGAGWAHLPALALLVATGMPSDTSQAAARVRWPPARAPQVEPATGVRPGEVAPSSSRDDAPTRPEAAAAGHAGPSLLDAAAGLGERLASGASVPVVEPLEASQREQLDDWFGLLGEPGPDESFGGLVARAAELRLGWPYGREPDREPEALRIRLDALDCVTLVEYADALARCSWQRTPGEACFVAEVLESRYRAGKLDGYGSRLHYFEEWLVDNASRGRLAPVVELPAVLVRKPFHFMSRHPGHYPPLRRRGVMGSIREVERALSRMAHPVVPRPRVATAQHALRSGDVLGFVTHERGLLVHHTGLVSVDGEGHPRVLHASSRQGRVVLSECDVAGCTASRADRRGIMVMRPVAPGLAAAPAEP